MRSPLSLSLSLFPLSFPLSFNVSFNVVNEREEVRGKDRRKVFEEK
jgi:hypothetical protein